MTPRIENFKTVWTREYCECGSYEIVYNIETRTCKCKGCGKEILK